jgi:drug/metabolite transporter (DMT)-like permease
MAVMLGLLAAVLWGVGDLFARFAGRAIGAWRTLFYTELVGLALLSAWFVIFEAETIVAVPRTVPGAIWCWGFLAGLIHLCGSYALVRGLTIGPISLVMPVATGYGAISAGLSIATGETVLALDLVGMLLTVIGTGLAAAEGRARKGASRAGVPWALTAALAYGVAFWAQGRFLIQPMGSIPAVWFFLAVGVGVMLALAMVRIGDLTPPSLDAMSVTAGSGILAVAAYVAVALGFATGEVAIVAVLSTLSSVVTALLGYFILGERLAPHQWAGAALIVVGIVTINAA